MSVTTLVYFSKVWQLVGCNNEHAEKRSFMYEPLFLVEKPPVTLFSRTVKYGKSFFYLYNTAHKNTQ